MWKKIVICINMILLLISARLAFNFLYNELVIYRYHQSNFTENIDILLSGNWIQPYVAYYNKGNIHYQNGEYLDAWDAYDKALAENPPQEEECSVRINKALAMIATLSNEYDSQDNIQMSIDTLKAARDVLLEGECATENGEGHSVTAENLKSEIEALLRELERKLESQSETSDDKEAKKEQSEDKTEEDAFEQDVKKVMQQRQSEANQERKEIMDFYEEFDREYNFDYDGYIW